MHTLFRCGQWATILPVGLELPGVWCVVFLPLAYSVIRYPLVLKSTIVGWFFALAAMLAPCLSGAQPAEIPYSRNDSAQIKLGDSLFAHLLADGNIKEACRQLESNATLFWEHNQLSRAVDYFLRSLTLNQQINNLNGIAGIHSNLAFIYADMGEYQKSYDYFEMTLAVRKQAGKLEGIISALINESVVLNQLSRFDESVAKLEEALRYARQLNSEVQMRSVYGMLSETYQKAGNAEKAMYFYGFYKTFNDYVTQKRVENAELSLAEQRLREVNLRLDSTRKANEIYRQRFEIATQRENLQQLTLEQQRLLDTLSTQEIAKAYLQKLAETQEKEKQILALDRARLAFQRLVGIIGSVLLLVALGFAILFLYRRSRDNRQLRLKNAQILAQSQTIDEQNEVLEAGRIVLENKTQELLSSIRYASQIQLAVLGHSTAEREMFAQSFRFSRPCEVVSGDFYYYRRLSQGDKLVVVGDCTGHGVPGAFLTLLGVTALDHAVFDLKLNSPSAILKEIDRMFSEINQNTQVAIHSMDVAVCIIREQRGAMEFAGARNGLLVVRDGQQEFYRGTLALIGSQNVEFSVIQRGFTDSLVPLTQGMWCYMYSDGLADQFNEEGEKFSSRRLRDLLASNANRSPEGQEEALAEAIDAWMGTEGQVDDMMLVGFSPMVGEG